MDSTIKWILGVLFSLVFGSYAFSYSNTSTIEDKLIKRLERIEDKIDSLLFRN